MPAYFPTVYGNREAKRLFGDACLGGTLSHAYLLEGPAGSGKKTFARAVAAALVCEKRGQTDKFPCGVCNRCRRVFEDNAPDVKTVRATGATLGVDIIRGMREDMYLSPTEPGPKVYLIPDAHKMTPQAQNALLKVLEEPPTELVVFLLTERAEALLTTVRSRVMLIRMELFSPEEEEVFLEKNTAAKRMREKDPDAFRALLEGSGGCLGTVLDRLDGKRAEAYAKKRKEVADAVAGALKTRSFSALLSLVRALPAKRQEQADELALYLAALRDLVLLSRTPQCSLSFYTDREAALALARDFGTQNLLKIYDLFVRATDTLAANGNVALTSLTLASELERLR